jgi:predicted ATP-grasp superfamily ATP-dependent carboligase
MPRSIDAIVLDARLRQSLVAVRSLGRRGLAVAALDVVPDVPTFWSRWCRRTFVCPAGEATDRYVSYVEQLAESLGTRVLITSHDGTIAVLRRHRARLERRVRLALSDEPSLTMAVNKERTLAVASRLGLRVPRGVVVSAVADVPAALREIGLPAVVKPTESWLCGSGHGVWVGPRLVTTPDEARQAIADIARLGGVSLFQRFLTGRREAVSLIHARGEIYARFAQWAKRMNPPLGGESVLRQSIAVPVDAGCQAERLVRELNVEGYLEVEFRRDHAGVPYLMEINARLSASVDLAVRCGVDFPYLLYQWASGAPIDCVRSYRIGRWMRYLQGDVMTTLAALEQRGRPGVATPLAALTGFGLSFLRPMRYDYVDWADPLPAVKAMADFSGETARSAVRAAARRARTFVSGAPFHTAAELVRSPGYSACRAFDEDVTVAAAHEQNARVRATSRNEAAERGAGVAVSDRAGLWGGAPRE